MWNEEGEVVQFACSRGLVKTTLGHCHCLALLRVPEGDHQDFQGLCFLLLLLVVNHFQARVTLCPRYQSITSSIHYYHVNKVRI